MSQTVFYVWPKVNKSRKFHAVSTNMSNTVHYSEKCMWLYHETPLYKELDANHSGNRTKVSQCV